MEFTQSARGLADIFDDDEVVAKPDITAKMCPLEQWRTRQRRAHGDAKQCWHGRTTNMEIMFCAV
jgi:hypothetical protein